MSTNKRVFTLRLNDEVFDKIGRLASEEHRSVTKLHWVRIIEAY